MKLSSMLVSLSCLLSISFSAFPMDGIAVTNPNGDGYYNENSSHHGYGGRILRFDISNDKVTNRPGEELVQNARCPSIDMSGNFVGFLRKDQDDRFWISVIPAEGGTFTDIIECNHEPNWFWWGIDAFYYDHMKGYRLMKVTIDSSDGTYRATQKPIAKFLTPVADGFSDLSMDGKIMHFRHNGCMEDDPCRLDRSLPGCNNDCEEIDGRHYQPIEEDVMRTFPYADVAGYRNMGSGCGCGISPFGKYVTFWGGGHQFSAMWNNETGGMPSIQNTTKSTWLVDGNNLTTTGGSLHGWSNNSDYWFTCEHDDLILVNWKDEKAINVTNSAYNHPSRGDMWCSTEYDVHPDLWHFIQNRDVWKSHWENILANLGESVNVTEKNRYLDIRLASHFNQILVSGNKINIVAKKRISGIDLFSSSGQKILTLQSNSNRNSIDISHLGNGAYILKIAAVDGAFIHRFMKY